LFSLFLIFLFLFFSVCVTLTVTGDTAEIYVESKKCATGII
jgi:hypothetical protein